MRCAVASMAKLRAGMASSEARGAERHPHRSREAERHPVLQEILEPVDLGPTGTAVGLLHPYYSIGHAVCLGFVGKQWIEVQSFIVDGIKRATNSEYKPK